MSPRLSQWEQQQHSNKTPLNWIYFSRLMFLIRQWQYYLAHSLWRSIALKLIWQWPCSTSSTILSYSYMVCHVKELVALMVYLLELHIPFFPIHRSPSREANTFYSEINCRRCKEFFKCGNVWRRLWCIWLTLFWC